jgi:hypothetical protein
MVPFFVPPLPSFRVEQADFFFPFLLLQKGRPAQREISLRAFPLRTGLKTGHYNPLFPSIYKNIGGGGAMVSPRRTTLPVYCLDLSPLFAILTKTPGVWGYFRHYILTSLLHGFAASQKANNISATPLFASIEESGSEPDDRRARQSEARLTGVAVGKRELRQDDPTGSVSQ